ncbi:MAG: sigma-70 family RNA polymerase sigma factor, partial [Bryobacteraceae bacterium]
HKRRLLRNTYRITRNHEDAEDALQDSFLRAFLHINRFDGRSAFSTWLTRIAINSALMIIRKRRNGRVTDMGIPGELGVEELEWDVTDHAANPEQSYAQREIENILASEIRALRPSIRTAIEMQQLQELSTRETAGRLGISVAAAKSRLFHGRVALRSAMRRKARGIGSRRWSK